MLWPAALALFFVNLILWIGTGFLGIEYSLTRTFFPLLFLLFLVFGTRELVLRVGSVTIDRTNRAFVLLGMILVATVLVSWSANFLQMRLPLEVSLFNLLVPATLALVGLLIWLGPASEATLRRTLGVVLGFAVLNAVLSAGIFTTANLLEIVPAEIFYVNERYPVSLIEIGGDAWVRTPGIFENGGSNGSFLLLTLGLTFAYLFFGPADRRSRRRAWGLRALVLLHIVLIVFTLTRRSLVALVVQLLLVAIIYFSRRRLVRPVLFTGLAFTVVGGTYVALPDVFSMETLSHRFGYWREAFELLGGNGALHVLFGFGVTQSSLDFLSDPGISIVDNSYLDLWMYGGALYFLAAMLWYGALLAVNLRVLRRRAHPHEWLAIFNVLTIATIAVTSLAAVFLGNLSEAFIYVVCLNLSTRYLVVTSPDRVIEQAAACP